MNSLSHVSRGGIGRQQYPVQKSSENWHTPPNGRIRLSCAMPYHKLKTNYLLYFFTLRYDF